MSAARATTPATGIALGFVIAGWVLYTLLAPIAVFLTWWDDCADVNCQVPAAIDQAAYAFDLVWWLAFPLLAWFAARGRRVAWAALLVVAIVLDAQVFVAFAGWRGFSGFGITLLVAALLTFGAALGLAMVTPRFRDRPGASSAGQVGAIGCLGLVVAVVALQGVAVGIGGPIVGIGIVMAVALFVIAVAAYANRDRRARAGAPPPGRSRPNRR
ncbi:MAG TPA: hypothetical protein VFV72_10260 [Candidatus Limnocylindrales bacterium]|nr:hypothetical protein [Candidatus Limnocylindrales bacterium]